MWILDVRAEGREQHADSLGKQTRLGLLEPHVAFLNMRSGFALKHPGLVDQDPVGHRCTAGVAV
jgi:hypothetical protein